MAAVEGYSLAMPHAAEVTSAPTSAIDLTSLVEAYAPLLFRVAHSILRSPSEAEDIVQDTFVRVLEHHQKAHHADLPAIRDLRVWLVRITWRLAIDRRRRVRPDQLDAAFAHSLAARLVPADRALDEAHQLAATFAAIETLPRKERESLLLSTIEDLTTPEIAAILNCSDSAVRALLFRARTHLREALTKEAAKQSRLANSRHQKGTRS